MRRRLELKGVEAAKLREIRNWIDLSGIHSGDQLTDLRKELKFDDSNVIGLYSGTMSNKQGIEFIIETAQALEESHPHIKFLLCGEGPQKKILQGLASGLRNIRFLDFQPAERFAELLLTADFHLIPQKAEAADLVLPSKLGAIFASGRPAIVMANLQTGLAEEVEGAGIVIPPGVASELSKAVVKLAENFELRSALGQNGRARATERWDKETILRSLVTELAGLENHRTFCSVSGENVRAPRLQLGYARPVCSEISGGASSPAVRRSMGVCISMTFFTLETKMRRGAEVAVCKSLGDWYV